MENFQLYDFVRKSLISYGKEYKDSLKESGFKGKINDRLVKYVIMDLANHIGKQRGINFQITSRDLKLDEQIKK